MATRIHPFTEGGAFQQCDVAKQRYIRRGDVFNLDGKSTDCNFDQAQGACILN